MNNAPVICHERVNEERMASRQFTKYRSKALSKASKGGSGDYFKEWTIWCGGYYSKIPDTCYSWCALN
jgi:hypothetical protein